MKSKKYLMETQDERLRIGLESLDIQKKTYNLNIAQLTLSFFLIVATVGGGQYLNLSPSIIIVMILAIIVLTLIPVVQTITLRDNSIINWRALPLLIEQRYLFENLKEKNVDMSKLYNDEVLLFYIAAIYEGKEKLAKELWEKVRLK